MKQMTLEKDKIFSLLKKQIDSETFESIQDAPFLLWSFDGKTLLHNSLYGNEEVFVLNSLKEGTIPYSGLTRRISSLSKSLSENESTFTSLILDTKGISSPLKCFCTSIKLSQDQKDFILFVAILDERFKNISSDQKNKKTSPKRKNVTERSSNLIRFLWKMDQSYHFTFISEDLSLETSLYPVDFIGHTFDFLETILIKDSDTAPQDALNNKQPWSGIRYLWPLHETIETKRQAVPVEFSATPQFSSDGIFEGFHGFGLIRLNERTNIPKYSIREEIPSQQHSDIENHNEDFPLPWSDSFLNELIISNESDHSSADLTSRTTDTAIDVTASMDKREDSSDREEDASLFYKETQNDKLTMREIARTLMRHSENNKEESLFSTSIENKSDHKSSEADQKRLALSDLFNAQILDSDNKELLENVQNITSLSKDDQSKVGDIFSSSEISTHLEEESKDENLCATHPLEISENITPPTLNHSSNPYKTRISELESILDIATDGVITIDMKGNILTLNRSAEALFGYNQEEIQGESVTALLATESHILLLDYLEGLQSGGIYGLLNGREVKGRVKQGGTIPLFLTMSSIGDQNHQKFCIVIRDLTDFKRAENDLLEAKSLAERSSAQKSDFLAKISHDVRTPMNAILGFTELMLEERFGAIGNARYHEYLNDIYESGRYVLSLINDLLDLAKIESGKAEMNFTRTNLNETVAKCVTLLQPEAAKSRVVLRASYSRKLPPIVADERALQQIIMNLLSNAVKYTESGGQVIISTNLSDLGEAVLRVRDTGIGMREDEIHAALEPYRQLATTHKKEGNGLGLSVTKALVEANRGLLHISSSLGQGTLVEVLFPPTRVLVE